MKPETPVFRFVLHADPNPMERLGARLPDGHLVDLQTAHLSMTGAPSPYLRDPSAFRSGGERALHTVREVLDWVDSQRPPGTSIPEARARILGSP